MSRHSLKERCWYITILTTYEGGIESSFLVPTHELNKQQRRLLLTPNITWKEVIESDLFPVCLFTSNIKGILWKYDLHSNGVDNIYKERGIKQILKKNSIVNMLTLYSYKPK